jgi:hypothetical protein
MEVRDGSLRARSHYRVSANDGSALWHGIAMVVTAITALSGMAMSFFLLSQGGAVLLKATSAPGTIWWRLPLLLGLLDLADQALRRSFGLTLKSVVYFDSMMRALYARLLMRGWNLWR